MQSLYQPGITIQDNHFSADAWIHEVVTYDGERIREYTNAQLINDWATTGAPLGPGQPLAVGGWPQFTSFNFRGSLDEFQMYGWALSLQEIQEMYIRGR